MNPRCNSCDEPRAIGVLTLTDPSGHTARWWTCLDCADEAAAYFGTRGYQLTINGPLEAHFTTP